MPSPDTSSQLAGVMGTSSFASILTPILTPPSLPSLPTTLLSARRAGRHRPNDARQQQSAAIPAPVPSIASTLTHSRGGMDQLNLSVRGEPAPKATGPVTREMAGWAKQAVAAAGHVIAGGRLVGSAVEEKEADSDAESEKVRAKSRRASRHATWNHFAASSVTASPTAATRNVLPAVTFQQPSSASSFVATYPSASSTASTMTVALTSVAGGGLPANRPFTSYSPSAVHTASADVTPLFANATQHGVNGSSELVHSTTSNSKPATRPGRRRSSLPLPASPPKPLSNATSPKRQPVSSWTHQSGTSSPTSTSPVMSSAYVAARSRGSSAWSRSAVDRFGVTGKPVDAEGEKNAWGFSELDDPPPIVRSPTTAPRIPTQQQHPAAITHSSGTNSPRPASAGSPSSSLPARPWNFGYVPTEEKGIRRTRNVQVDVDPHAYQQRTTTRVQQSVPHFEPIRVARPPRRRRAGDDEVAEERPWGHWAQAGLTEEPKYPFPGRKFIFRDCPLRKSECTDKWCAKHYRRAGEVDVEGELEDEVEEKKDEREVEATEVEMEELSVGEDGVGAVDNMAVVRLRGASDRAFKAAFARATPAYAALAKKTSKALADSSELHRANAAEPTDFAEDRKQQSLNMI